MAKSIYSAILVAGFFALGCGGGEAPGFSVESVETGKKVKLSDFKGKVVVLDFWATWCAPCIAAMPKTGSMYQRLKDKGLVVMGITREDRTTVEAFLKARSVSYPLYLDTSGEMGGPTSKYQADVLPTMVIIGRDGAIKKRHVGFAGDLSEVEKEIEKLL